MLGTCYLEYFYQCKKQQNAFLFSFFFSGNCPNKKGRVTGFFFVHMGFNSVCR